MWVIDVFDYDIDVFDFDIDVFDMSFLFFEGDHYILRLKPKTCMFLVEQGIISLYNTMEIILK